MQETEVKFYVSDLDGVRTRLHSLKANLIQERILETNIRFDLPDGGLRSEGRVLRLRQDTAARLTYKSASMNDQGILSRQEIEFVVEDFEKARLFLEALGYRKLVYYEKYRATYTLKTSDVLTDLPGLVRVMLDELPYGNFVEIEGENVESIQTASDKLRLKQDSAIPTSYHVLFERLCTNHPELDPADLSFAALKRLTVTAADLSVRAADS